MAALIEIAQGSATVATITIYAADGVTPFSGYSSSDTLTPHLWEGQSRASVSSGPTAAWKDVTAGQFYLTFPSSLTSTLTPGIYRLEVDISHGGETYSAIDPRTQVKVIGGPGSDATLPTYISYQDIRDHFSSIDLLQDAESDDAGFLKQRAKARAKLDKLAQRHVRPTIAIMQTQFQVLAGGYMWRTGRDNDWLTSQLAANALMVDESVKQQQIFETLHLIFSAQIGRDKDNTYQDLARRYGVRSDTALSMLTLQLDTNGDGKPDYTIDMSLTDVLRS